MRSSSAARTTVVEPCADHHVPQPPALSFELPNCDPQPPGQQDGRWAIVQLAQRLALQPHALLHRIATSLPGAFPVAPHAANPPPLLLASMTASVSAMAAPPNASNAAQRRCGAPPGVAELSRGTRCLVTTAILCPCSFVCRAGPTPPLLAARNKCPEEEGEEEETVAAAHHPGGKRAPCCCRGRPPCPPPSATRSAPAPPCWRTTPRAARCVSTPPACPSAPALSRPVPHTAVRAEL